MAGFYVDDPVPPPLAVADEEVRLQPIRFTEIVGFHVESTVRCCLQDLRDHEVLQHGAAERTFLQGILGPDAREVAYQSGVPEEQL